MPAIVGSSGNGKASGEMVDDMGSVRRLAFGNAGSVSVKVLTAIAAAMLAMPALAQTPPSAPAPDSINSMEEAIAASRRPGLAFHGDPSVFFGPDSYPAEAMRAGEQGRVIALLVIATDGHVKSCYIRETSGSAALDGVTCRIALAKVVFTPAMNAVGRPVEGVYTLPVNWVLPQAVGTTPRTSSNEVIRLETGADDRLTGCSYTVNGQAVTAEGGPCTTFTAAQGAMMATLKGALAGRPAAITMQRLVQFEGEPPIAEVRARPGETTLQVFRVAFDVGPDGARLNQRTLAQAGSIPAMPDPSADLGRFAAAPGRTDHVQVLGSVSVRPLP